MLNTPKKACSKEVLLQPKKNTKIPPIGGATLFHVSGQPGGVDDPLTKEDGHESRQIAHSLEPESMSEASVSSVADTYQPKGAFLLPEDVGEDASHNNKESSERDGNQRAKDDDSPDRLVP